MSNKMRRINLIAAVMLLMLTACSKKDDTTPDFEEQNLVPLSIEFDNIVGGRTLTLNNTAVPYTNAKGESFTISMIQYFISNVEVTTTAGQKYTVKQDSSYFLIKGSDKATRFAKVKVPEGDYSKVSFIVGVDSLRSTMPIDKRTGVLDPAANGDHDSGGMYWGWNSGYIFFRFEGNSNVVSDDQLGDPTGKKQFKYHIGFFGGYEVKTINNIRKITIDLNNAGIAKVRKDRQSNIHLLVDLMKIFNGKNTISIQQNPNIMFGDMSSTVADNFNGLFTHDHTEN